MADSCSCGGALLGLLRGRRGTEAGAPKAQAVAAPAVDTGALTAAEGRSWQLQERASELEDKLTALEASQDGEAPLLRLLVQDCGVSLRVFGRLIHELGVEGIADFAECWTAHEFEAGVCKILAGIASLANPSQPGSKLEVARLRAAWSRARAHAANLKQTRLKKAKHVVGMGWSTPAIYDGICIDDVWATLSYQARHPDEFFDVSDVNVSVRQGFLARTMRVNATGQRLDEHIYMHEREGEAVYRAVDSNDKSETEYERVIAVKEHPLRLEFFQRNILDGCRSYWRMPIFAVRGMLMRLLAHARKSVECGHFIGLGFSSHEIEDVSHDAVWRAMLESIRKPVPFFGCFVDSIEEGEGFVHRSLTTNGVHLEEHVYIDEQSCEIIQRRLVDGLEVDVERVMALRAHPLLIEFHMRSRKDGFRVHWDAPKEDLLRSVQALVREAQRMDSEAPTRVGYGVTSDPIQGCSYGTLFAAVELSIREPWRVFDVRQCNCEVQVCEGHIQRTMRLASNGKCVVERITVNEEAREISYNRCSARGEPSEVERVLAIHIPLRMEFYERSTRSGLREDWAAPCRVARGTFTKMIQLARTIETGSTGMVGFGMASEPLTGMEQDALWKAMIRVVRHPAAGGLKVKDVSLVEKNGYMQRSMKFCGNTDGVVETENIRVLEHALEITMRHVVNGREAEKEHVFALRTDPLQLELFSRQLQGAIRLDWQAPRSKATCLFDATLLLAKSM